MRSRNTVLLSISLLATAGIVAWKMGFIPLHVGPAETGELASAGAVELDEESAEPADPPVDPMIFTTQGEPPVEEGENQAAELASERPLFERFLTRPSPSSEADAPVEHVPARARPLVDSAHEHETVEFASATAPEERRPRPSPILQVSNEEPRVANSSSANVASEVGRPRPAPPTGDNAAAGGIDWTVIDRQIEAADYLTAHRELSKVYWNQPELRDEVRGRIETTARAIFFSPQPHFLEPYVIQPNDQLRVIAKKYEVPWQYMARLNNTDPRRIRPGQKLKVIKGPFSALVDVSDFELTIHLQGYYVKRYSVGVGKDGTTPLGKFAVRDKLENPVYYGPEGNVIGADDPTNPLGERWIDIGDSYGIHGTIDPESIGRAESRGCIRLRSEDVAEVYDLLEIGSEVVIRP